MKRRKPKKIPDNLIIDSEDYDLVSQYSWHVGGGRYDGDGYFYARIRKEGIRYAGLLFR